MGDVDLLVRMVSSLETCELEVLYLKRCDSRLFINRINSEFVEQLPDNDELMERVDAFVARFGRLQDTLGDKLIPGFLKLMQESPGTMLENLDRMERLDLIDSADDWFAIRKLRNRMIHEYVKDPRELADALNAAHDHVAMLEKAYLSIKSRISKQYPELSKVNG